MHFIIFPIIIFIGIPIFILLFFLSNMKPLCIPITFELLNNIIGDPDEPSSVANEYKNKFLFFVIIFPCE